jgi:hypothetical protein
MWLMHRERDCAAYAIFARKNMTWQGILIIAVVCIIGGLIICWLDEKWTLKEPHD